MAEKGLKIVATFEKKVDNNQPMIIARLVIERAEGVDICSLMYDSGGDYYVRSMKREFKTATEAQMWAGKQSERIRSEYATTIARIKALEVPEDFEVYN